MTLPRAVIANAVKQSGMLPGRAAMMLRFWIASFLAMTEAPLAMTGSVEIARRAITSVEK
jgi:hypothetical protein